MLASLTLLVVVMVVFLAGLRELLVAHREQRRLANAVLDVDADAQALFRWSRLDRLVRRTAAGTRLAAALEGAGITLSPGRFVVAGAAVCALLALLLGMTMSWLLTPVGAALGVLLARTYIRRQRNKRREAFIAQMPELARILSNATSAGLSIRTAVALAADDLAEPAASELRAVTEQMNLGTSLRTALDSLEERLPSREVAILVGTLVVSSRSGGALVSALRDIAGTLETRKETRREVRTTYSQIVATAYTTAALGVFVLFILNRINPGTIDLMLRSALGQVALVVAGAMYAVGFLLVRRMTRVEV